MQDYEVVIVGAGPAGLTAAVALGCLGVEVLLVERSVSGSPLPRATVLSMRTMELMRAFGLEESVRSGADEVEMTMLEAPTATRAAEGTVVNVGYPTARQSRLLSPTEALCVAQDHLEWVLLDHLRSLDSVTVERGLELIDLVEDEVEEVVTVTMRDGSGRLRTAAAGHVIGADGARSAVRAGLGLEMTEPDGALEGLRVEFRAPMWEVVGEHRHLLYAITEPGAAGVLLPAGQGDRWQFGCPHEDPGALPNEDELREMVRRAAGVSDLPVQIERCGWFSSSAQLAERFSRGRVHLVGDAAHRVTPRGGTGLNIAVADGFDLGWKLGWVRRGWASESLLQTYETERRPVVEHNLTRSSDPFGSRREADTELGVDLGGRIRHAWVEPASVSTLDLIGHGLTLFVGSDAAAWAEVMSRVSVAGEPPVDFVLVDSLVARGLGFGLGGALLARPDGVPVASWWGSADAHDLHRAATLLTGRPVHDHGKRQSAA